MTEKIKYANCWEDADLLLLAAQLTKGSNILSIASAGDNSFALLSTTPNKLYAVDMNIAQLHLCELKAAAFSELNYDEMIAFLNGSNQSRDYFESLKKQLTPACKNYWEDHLNVIQTGVIHSGKFETYFRVFRNYILPCIHSRKQTEYLLLQKSREKQYAYYQKEWNSWRWELLFKLFFSKFILGRFGRTKEYLNQVNIPVSDFIYSQADAQLQSENCQDNYFLHYIFTGQFKPQLPFYLRKENFEPIRQNLHVLTLKHGYVHDYINQENDFNYCNFSNIFEYMSIPVFTEFHQIMQKNLPHKAKISYWNLMVDRVFSEHFQGEYVQCNHELRQHDKGFFYKRFVTESKQ